ncbi:hypothetical protein CDV31_015166 [Fusarium ambrosium]|uniref:Uncharacterized protein n=1 Tax=Fusarium ambrosium TaxID=131363 RepID=A0A428SRL4_9HYPO|nr:hypothetical protein CDV31_015166 [Fusarium ambrosium]
MCGHGNSPTPPSSEDGSYEGSDAGGPRYTPEELGALFLDFYKFLTTLHYDEADLKVPPPGGWPQMTPESCLHFKSDYAIEVLRHLPYFDSKCTAYIHFKSRLIDFAAFTSQDYEKHKNNHEGLEFWSDEGQVNPSDVVCIAVGGESFARQLWLNVKDCEIHEDMVAGDMLDAVQVEAFFENLKEQYRSLKLIPGRGRITIEAGKMAEREDRILTEEVRNQTGEWGTELDIQYVRQIYRQHGWPDAFRKEEAFRAIDDWIDPLYESRYEWARSPPDWDSTRWT